MGPCFLIQFCQLGQNFLVSTSASLGNGNAVNPHATCLFSVVSFSYVGKQVWCGEFKCLASCVSQLPGIRMLLSETYIISSLFAFDRE